jgi:hypothetical protein
MFGASTVLWGAVALTVSSCSPTEGALGDGQDAWEDAGSLGDKALTGECDDVLRPGEYLQSPNKRYRLFLQRDSNLVLRDWTTKKVLWASKSVGKGARELALSADGDLVIYSEANLPIWSSKTAGSSADSLQVTDDGALVLFAGSKAIWAVNGTSSFVASAPADSQLCAAERGGDSGDPADPADPGDPADQCPDDPNKTLPGQCGCGAPEERCESDEYFQEDCRDLASLEGDSTVPYYRLRVEYVSSADWSKLNFAEPESIYKVRTMSTSGVTAVDKALAEFDGFTVNQPSSSAKAGKKIAMTADFALKPHTINAPLILKLGKGTIGSSTIRVSTVVNGNAQLIREVTHTRGAQIEVDLSSLKGVPPTNAPIAKVRRMAWALYYPWYTMSRWDDSEMKDKAQYPYDSSDPVAIKRQITQAKSAGIDGFLSSWWGAGSRTDRNLPVVLDVAGQNNFSIGMFLETRSIVEAKKKNWPLVEDELVRWLELYVTTYGSHPAAMKVDGKPLIVPWVTCTVPVDTWRNVRRRMKEHNLEATIIADCRVPEYFDVFDGALGGDAKTGRIIRYHALLADSPSPKIWMSSAMPGFDERLLPDRVNPRNYEREDGAYFKRELNTALEAKPQWLRLYTWNEYPENTHIEPSKNFGDKYLRLAAEYVLPWKCPQ